MLAQYLTFVSYFNREIFTLGSLVLAKFNKSSLKKVDDLSKGMLIAGASLNMLFPVLLWLCIKFGYHFPVELLFLGAANLIEPIVYFYDKFGPGKCI